MIPFHDIVEPFLVGMGVAFLIAAFVLSVIAQHLDGKR